jgi:phage terminase large subunit
MSIPEAEKWPMVADSARPETISHMRKNGFPKIQSAVKGAKSVEEGVEWLKSLTSLCIQDASTPSMS